MGYGFTVSIPVGHDLSLNALRCPGQHRQEPPRLRIDPVSGASPQEAQAQSGAAKAGVVLDEDDEVLRRIQEVYLNSDLQMYGWLLLVAFVMFL